MTLTIDHAKPRLQAAVATLRSRGFHLIPPMDEDDGELGEAVRDLMAVRDIFAPIPPSRTDLLEPCAECDGSVEQYDHAAGCPHGAPADRATPPNSVSPQRANASHARMTVQE